MLANSAGIERMSRAMGAERTRIVHLGADVPNGHIVAAQDPTLVTVGHLVARKRHADVLRAMWLLRDRLPALRYLVIGDGPERASLERLAGDLGLTGQVEFAGQLPHTEALARMRRAHVFVLPSTDEAFGVAYVEAMASGMPAVGALGEPGPEEITGAGDGMVLVPPGDPEVLAGAIEELFARAAAARGARRARARDGRARVLVARLREGDGRRLRGRPGLSRRPVLFVTNLVAPDRVGAFRALHARSEIELALFGGRSHHATGAVLDHGIPSREVEQADVMRLAASGNYRAVVCGTAGRLALPAAWAGARRAGVPFVLWSALWAHPRSAAHVAGAVLLRTLYRDADAVVAYGPHVASFARRNGARRVAIAPQAVDGTFWSARPDGPELAPRGGVRRRVRRARRAGQGARRAARRVVARAPRAAIGRARARGRGRDAGRGGSATTRVRAQLPVHRGRCGRTVATDQHLPRALGARRERGHARRHTRDRHRPGRRRRRRPRPQRPQRPRRAVGGPGRPGRCAAAAAR